MIERIKAMPFGVKLSVLFLLISYISLFFLVPQVALFIAFLLTCFTAAYRIINYIVDGC